MKKAGKFEMRTGRSQGVAHGGHTSSTGKTQSGVHGGFGEQELESGSGSGKTQRRGMKRR